MRANKYPGKCEYCGGHVEANAGRLRKHGWKWKVAHLACSDKQGPSVITVRFGGSDKVYTRNANGRCLDAPCCGCCTI